MSDGSETVSFSLFGGCGAFRSFEHEHHFVTSSETTIMRDVVTFRSPLGPLGRVANRLFLTDYLTNFLRRRNEVIRVGVHRRK